MCKETPAAGLKGSLFISGNVITFVGILIWTEIVDITRGKMDYAIRSDLTLIPKLHEFQHQAGNQCLYFYAVQWH